MSGYGSVIRCSNMSMYNKMSELAGAISVSHSVVDSSIHSFPDMAVVAEMVIMLTESRKCRHGTHARKPTKTFERPDPFRTPSYLEEMYMHSTMGMCAREDSSVRSNKVTCAIISDCVSVFEFMQRYERSDLERGKIIITDVLSVTHAATVAYVFEIISAIKGWDGSVIMVMLTLGDMHEAMSVYVNVRTNVFVEKCMSAPTRLSQLLNMDKQMYTTIVSHDPACKRLIMNTNLEPNVDVNMLISLDTVSKERDVRNYCWSQKMLVEMCPCSNVSMNVARVVPEHEPMDTFGNKIMHRNKDASMFAKMSWYTNMIRSMSMGSMCYDCSVASMFAKSMILALTGEVMDEKMNENANWRESYVKKVEPLQDVD